MRLAGGSSSNIAMPPRCRRSGAFGAVHQPTAQARLAARPGAGPSRCKSILPVRQSATDKAPAAAVSAPSAAAAAAVAGRKTQETSPPRAPGAQQKSSSRRCPLCSSATPATPEPASSSSADNATRGRAHGCSPSTISINCSAVFRSGRIRGSADTRIRKSTLFAASSSSRAVLACSGDSSITQKKITPI